MGVKFFIDKFAGIMTTKRYILLFIAFAFVIYGKAQQNSHATESQKLQQLNVALDGTYQIQIIDSRELPMLPLTLLPQIDSLRKESDTVYISVKNNERIMVLPKKVINSPDFIKPQHVQYISTQ